VIDAPHHDGSELYLPEPPLEAGDTMVVRLRVPRSLRVDAVAVRYVQDGEPRFARAERDEETATEVWWAASFEAVNPRTRYRWLLSGGDMGYAWLNGAGLVGYDVPDADDFVVALGAQGPDWHLRSVVYEIFPDRFASSGASHDPPEWATPRRWDEQPSPGRVSGRDWFGANVLYLTPFFPAGSMHRYDASTFDHVDPLLGGDEALRSLAQAAHARGLRVLGDLTLNHIGEGHEWFRAALADPGAPERDFFIFDDGAKHGYETWLGVRQLPKLDHRSAELERRLANGPGSVVRRWLDPESGLDGWRIDVANMTGRLRDVDLNRQVARAVRRAVIEAREDGVVVAEHGYDARDDLHGDGWHGVMNYAGFFRPLWAWLRDPDGLTGELASYFNGVPVGVPRLPGSAIVETMRRFRAGTPWPAVLHSWVLLDSHDTARFSVVAGSRERHLVGVGMQMTTPGVPMVWAGDEIGLGGDWGEDARRPMPWQARESWDDTLFECYRELIELRRSSDALARGGIRYVHVDDDAIAYLRETRDERVLCLARRAKGAPIEVPSSALGAEAVVTLVGEDAETHGDALVLPAAGPAFHAWRIE
jgi:alpha-glucosidase